MTDFVKCRLRTNFWIMGSIYLSFETCYEIDIMNIDCVCVCVCTPERIG